MKILFASIENSNDIAQWSGLVYFIRRSLESAGFDVDAFHDLTFDLHPMQRIFDWGYRYGRKERHYFTLEPTVLRSLARQIERKFDSDVYDLVFSPYTGVPVTTFLRPGIAVFSYGDATKFDWINSYFKRSKISQRTLNNARQVDQAMLSSHSAVFFASEWAAEGARNNYRVDASKVHVIPFGANIVSPRSQREIYMRVQSRAKNVCNLLFMGVEWGRKGGDVVFEVAGRLHRSGFPVCLLIAGVIPPDKVAAAPFTRCVGFLDKSNTRQLEVYFDAYLNSHFLLMLPEAEAYGLVYCEASAFGVPSISTGVGGISTIIRSGRNGMLFERERDLDSICAYIKTTFTNRDYYVRLAMSSHQEFRTRLNWEVAGRNIRRIVTSRLVNK